MSENEVEENKAVEENKEVNADSKKDESYHHGALAHPHDAEAQQNIRGAKKVTHDEGEEGETALVTCGTSKGTFVAKFHRDWAPLGYDRATALFSKGFYDHSHFFRVVPKFLVQFGISYSKDMSLKTFAGTQIADDPYPEPRRKFTRGLMAFAGSGPNSRTSQMFISYGDNPGLGQELWEVPFGEVIEGMEHVEALYSYGDMPPWGKGPVQGKIHSDPNYIKNDFPLLDKFETCTVKINKPSSEAVAAAEKADTDDGQVEKVALGLDEHAANGGRQAKEVGEGPGGDGDDPLMQEQKQAEKETLDKAAIAGPFDDFVQVGAIVAGIIVVLLIFASLSRRKGKKKQRRE